MVVGRLVVEFVNEVVSSLCETVEDQGQDGELVLDDAKGAQADLKNNVKDAQDDLEDTVVPDEEDNNNHVLQEQASSSPLEIISKADSQDFTDEEDPPAGLLPGHEIFPIGNMIRCIVGELNYSPTNTFEVRPTKPQRFTKPLFPLRISRFVSLHRVPSSIVPAS